MAQLFKSKIALVVLLLLSNLFFADYSKAKDSRPDRRVSGGTRTGNCLLAEETGSSNSLSLKDKLIALIPESQSPLQSTGTLTLWFYVPFKSQQSIAAEFRLKQKIGDRYTTIDKKAISISPNETLFSITVPQDQMQVGQDYQWWFSVSCDPNDPSKDATVYARVQPIEVNSKLQANLRSTKTIRQKIQAYQAAGLWYNVLPTVMELSCQDSQQAQVLFSEFLQSIQLSEIVPFAKPSLLKTCRK